MSKTPLHRRALSDVLAKRFLIRSDPITSVQQTSDGNAVLVSTLDSVVRLMDKSNGQMLQSYKGHINKAYRIRSCLGLGDAVVISGSEDGSIYVWDLLEAKVCETLSAHDGKVASAVACNSARKEFASAGVDGIVACPRSRFDLPAELHQVQSWFGAWPSKAHQQNYGAAFSRHRCMSPWGYRNRTGQYQRCIERD